jgi:hypothetical protein
MIECNRRFTYGPHSEDQQEGTHKEYTITGKLKMCAQKENVERKKVDQLERVWKKDLKESELAGQGSRQTISATRKLNVRKAHDDDDDDR